MILSRAGRARIAAVARGRSDEPLRVLEGPKSVLDALPLGVVAEVWVRRDIDARVQADLAAAAARAGLPLGEGTPEDFDRLADTVSPQGVIALVRDTAVPIETVVGAPGPLLWLDGLQDPGNAGAVVRVAAAFGAGGILAGDGTADLLGLKALRASAGLALRVPFARGASDRIAAALAAAARPVWLLDAGGDDLFELRGTPARLTLLVGGEGRGAGAAARAAAARRVGIPMAPGVDSLNAAVACGIAASRLFRRA